jgi:hypothetical protein
MITSARKHDANLGADAIGGYELIFGHGRQLIRRQFRKKPLYPEQDYKWQLRNLPSVNHCNLACQIMQIIVAGLLN